MASFKINTGVKVYDIENERGEVIGQIKINTKDMGFVTRAKDTQNKISEILKSMSKDVESEDEMAAIIKSADEQIKKEIDILFNDSVSDIVFGNQNCLNTLDGITFVERFLQAVVPTIQKDLSEEIEKSNNRVDKYVKQVQ